MEGYDVRDEEKGITFTIPRFYVDDPEELYDEYKKEIFEAIVNSTIMMVAQDYDTIPCFVMNEDICNIHADSIHVNLDKALEYYANEEMYETCKEIKNLKLYL